MLKHMGLKTWYDHDQQTLDRRSNQTLPNRSRVKKTQNYRKMNLKNPLQGLPQLYLAKDHIGDLP